MLGRKKSLDKDLKARDIIAFDEGDFFASLEEEGWTQ